MSSSFEEAEFGGRKVVSAGKPEKPEKTGKPEGGGRRRKAEEGRGKKKRKQKPGHKASSPSRKAKKANEKTSRQDVGLESSGTGVLVPLDQWTRVLNQLGNLHEAGQQIAEARERAAKAETEAAFLKERMRELRAELEVYKRTQGD